MKLLRCTLIYDIYDNPKDIALSCIFINKDFIKCFHIQNINSLYCVKCTTKDGREYFVEGFYYDSLEDAYNDILDFEND